MLNGGMVEIYLPESSQARKITTGGDITDATLAKNSRAVGRKDIRI